MPGEKLRRIQSPVIVRIEDASNIPKRNVHRHTASALCRSANIILVSRHALAHGRVERCSEEEDAGVFSTVIGGDDIQIEKHSDCRTADVVKEFIRLGVKLVELLVPSKPRTFQKRSPAQIRGPISTESIERNGPRS